MSRLPRSAPGLGDYLREQRRRVRQQGYASAFSRSGLNVTGEGEIASDDFDGDIANRDAGTAGWGASGGTLAAGDLLLRPRSIGDDSLSSLLSGDFMGGTQLNFAVPASGVVLASHSLQVPDGFTGALVTNTSFATANNTSANSDYIYVSTIIDTPIGRFAGGQAFTSLAAGAWASACACGVAKVEGMVPGDTVTCAVNVSSGNGWSAQAANSANLNVTVIWFR